MNKTQLIDRVNGDLELSKKDTQIAVNAILESITEELSEGNEVKLPNFGKFSVRRKEAYTARNPQNGEPVDVPAKNVVKFKAAKALKDSVNEE
jgi:nucleoid DNA-binding protein